MFSNIKYFSQPCVTNIARNLLEQIFHFCINIDARQTVDACFNFSNIWTKTKRKIACLTNTFHGRFQLKFNFENNIWTQTWDDFVFTFDLNAFDHGHKILRMLISFWTSSRIIKPNSEQFNRIHAATFSGTEMDLSTIIHVLTDINMLKFSFFFSFSKFLLNYFLWINKIFRQKFDKWLFRFSAHDNLEKKQFKLFQRWYLSWKNNPKRKIPITKNLLIRIFNVVLNIFCFNKIFLESSTTTTTTSVRLLPIEREDEPNIEWYGLIINYWNIVDERLYANKYSFWSWSPTTRRPNAKFIACPMITKIRVKLTIVSDRA